MQQMHDIFGQWWAATDSTTHMAIIAFGLFVFVYIVFSAIGMHTNPARKPHNEIDFRNLARAGMSAKNEAPAEHESDGETPISETLTTRPILARRP